MKFHDYHLEKYEVSDRGRKISFHLVYGYEGEETDESFISFDDVAFYDFVHIDNAIFTDIEEVSLKESLLKAKEGIEYKASQFGLRYWNGDFNEYSEALETQGYRSWYIESAIGFWGFIIAKGIYPA